MSLEITESWIIDRVKLDHDNLGKQEFFNYILYNLYTSKFFASFFVWVLLDFQKIKTKFLDFAALQNWIKLNKNKLCKVNVIKLFAKEVPFTIAYGSF